MNFHVLTLFPEMINDGVNTSITGRAISKGLISVNAVNIRDFAGNKYGQVDDYPYGGGAGMVMQPGPVYRSYESIKEKIGYKPRVIYLTPQGKVFNQSMAEEFAEEKDLVFLCGHYEGIDERVLEMIVTDNVSIGDYVLTGGELPSMVMIDAISRLVPGVIMMFRQSLNLLMIICWNIHNIQDLLNLWEMKFHLFCCQAIIRRLMSGEDSSLF